MNRKRADNESDVKRKLSSGGETVMELDFAKDIN